MARIAAAVRPVLKSRMNVSAPSSPGLRSHIQNYAFALRVFSMMVDFVLNVANSIAFRIGIFQRQVEGVVQRDILRASIHIGHLTEGVPSNTTDCSI